MTEHRLRGATPLTSEATAQTRRSRGRTMAIGRLAKATALLAGALITISTLQAAPASAAAARRVVPIAGTGHFLVYGTYTPTVGMTTVRLYSRDDRGRTRPLGSVQSSTPSRISATAAGTTLVAAKDATANYRWDLTTGARTTIGPQTVAAPNGYATVGADGASGADARQAVLLVTPAGATNIGVPFPNGENADGAFHLSSGSAGVTITDGNGHIRFIAFASPGTVRSLHTVNRGASVPVLSCSSFTSTSVACLAFDEETTTLLGLRLSGSRVITTTPPLRRHPSRAPHRDRLDRLQPPAHGPELERRRPHLQDHIRHRHPGERLRQGRAAEQERHNTADHDRHHCQAQNDRFCELTQTSSSRAHVGFLRRRAPTAVPPPTSAHQPARTASRSPNSQPNRRASQ